MKGMDRYTLLWIMTNIIHHNLCQMCTLSAN